MKAYKNIKLDEGSSIASIRAQGRKSSIGRLGRGQVSTRYIDNIVFNANGTPGRQISKIVHNDRGYCTSPKNKAAARRYLKHVDRYADLRFEFTAEENI